MSPPEISVVIVNWNTREILSHCLSSLKADLDAGRCEVIVVDNGSTDGSAESVADSFPAVRLVRNARNRGFTAATNQGFELASGRYVLMLNSDTEVSQTALRDSAAFLDAHPDVGIVGCRLTYPDGAPQSSCFRFPSLLAVCLRTVYLEQTFKRSPVFNWDRYGYEPFRETRPVDCVMGSFMMIRADAIVDRPLLDEGYFMYAEEADLCFRLQAAGWRVMFHPEPTVIHHHGGSSGANPRVAAWSYEARQRAILRFLRKWKGVPVASLANFVMLVGLIPRVAAWGLADVVSAFRGNRRFRRVELLKAHSIRFHLAAALRPSLFDSSWAPAWVDGGPGAENP